jgi:transposase InsO family protein
MAIRELNEEQQYSIEWMCEKLDISRASYYKWLNREIPAKELEDKAIAEKIEEYHKHYGGILGYRRMTIFLNRREGTNYKPRRIRRIMGIIGVHSTIRRVRSCCTVSNRKDQKAENLLKRNFEASAPNEKWTTDVTEFKTPGKKGKIYLSAFMDLYDRSVVAWAVSRRNDNNLVFDTFRQAIAANPEAAPLFHSDRGFQYTSPVFKQMLAEQGMTQSMSRVACCIDNGPQEGFWGIIKTEMPGLCEYDDEASLIEAIDRYIDFYNTERYQERFECKTPMEVRTEAMKAEVPKAYPIPANPRIEKYHQYLAEKQSSSENASRTEAGG